MAIRRLFANETLEIPEIFEHQVELALKPPSTKIVVFPLFVAFTLLSGMIVVQPVGAQPASPGYAPVDSYGPVVANGSSLGDPYAMTGPGGFVASPIGGLRGFGWMPMVDRMANRLWVRTEYLRWKTDGMQTPVLVTTSPNGTPQNQSAILGQPGVSTLFGGGEINGDDVSGLRIRMGFWLNQQAAFGIEGEIFGLKDQNDGFSQSATGATILGRPFFDVTNDRETAQLISFPGLVEGNIRVTSDTDLRSLLINGRVSLCPNCGGGHCMTCRSPNRIDWIIGYRRIELDDSLTIAENVNSLLTSAPGTIALSESFRTSNEFNGLQLGIIHQRHFRRAWLESMLRIAVGNNTQTVRINGSSTISEPGSVQTYPGGLLAQRTNIGNYERDQFVMIPELGLTLGMHLTDWLDATIGYTVLYLPNVVRAGNQIDTDINPNLIPAETVPFTGSLRPGFQFVESDYLAHGLSFGGELRF